MISLTKENLEVAVGHLERESCGMDLMKVEAAVHAPVLAHTL